MGFSDKLRKFGSAIARTLGMSKVADKIAGDVEVTSSGSERKYPRFLHVSKQVHPVDEPLASILGVKFIADRVGLTMSIGANRIKRHADSMGRNNKERRRLRAAMKRRHRELIAQHEVAHA